MDILKLWMTIFINSNRQCSCSGGNDMSVKLWIIKLEIIQAFWAKKNL